MRKIIFIIFSLVITNSILHAQDLTKYYDNAKQRMSAKNFEDAVSVLELLADSDYILKDYVIFDLAYCYQQLGENDLALENYMKIIEKYRSSPMFKKSLLPAIRLKSLKNLYEAERMGKDYLANFSDDDEIATEIIRFFVNMGRAKEFENNLKNMFFKGGNNIDFAYQQIKSLNIKISKTEIKNGLKEAFKRGKYIKVIKIIEEERESDEDSKLLLGKSYFLIRNYNAAIKYLIDTSSREGKIFLASAFLRNNDRLAAEIILKKLANETEDGLYDLYLRFAELKRRDGRFLDAAKEFERLYDVFPEKRTETLWCLAWLNIITENYQEAEVLLEKILKNKYYTDKDKILFWLGKIQIYKGSDDRGYFSQISPKSYYAFRLNINREIEKKKDSKELEELLPENINMAFLRALELQKLSMNVYVSMEIKAVSKEVTQAHLPQIAERLTALQEYDTLLQISEKFGEINSYTYPLAYNDKLHKISKKEGVDTLLVLAIMREESRFNPKVVSVAGAIGLMQLMPKTAKLYSRINDIEDIYQPDNNIKAGVKHISKLLKEYRNIWYAVAAYNAGEHRVNNWIKNKYRDIDMFVEDIPFPETRNYVKKVLKSYYIYKKLYGEQI